MLILVKENVVVLFFGEGAGKWFVCICLFGGALDCRRDIDT